jgi:hypothetical protein
MTPQRMFLIRCVAVLMTVVAAASVTSAAVGAEVLTPDRYIERLHLIDAALAQGDLAQATALSASCVDGEVSWPNGQLTMDPTIHVLISSSASAQARLRIAAVLDECSAAAVPGTGEADGVSVSRLARIAQQESEAQSGLRHGGSIAGLPEAELPLPVSWKERIVNAIRWVGDVLRRAIDWVIDWLRGHPTQEHPEDSSSPVLVISCVLVGVILVVAAVMAWRAWRTRSAVVPRLSSAPAAAGVDADPPLAGGRRMDGICPAAVHRRALP